VLPLAGILNAAHHSTGFFNRSLGCLPEASWLIL